MAELLFIPRRLIQIYTSDGDRMMNSKSLHLTVFVLLLAFFLAACTPGSVSDPDGQTTGSQPETRQSTADQTTSPPGDNSSLLVIKDFLTPEEINAILGIKPKGYRDYNMYQDNAWAYFDFDEDTDSMGLCLHVQLFSGDAVHEMAPYPLQDDAEASRNEFVDVAVAGVIEKMRITYYTDYVGEGFANKVEKNRDMTLALKKGDSVYLLHMYGPDHIIYKQSLAELMAVFVRNVEAKLSVKR